MDIMISTSDFKDKLSFQRVVSNFLGKSSWGHGSWGEWESTHLRNVNDQAAGPW